ncbi:hypothetical protein [Tritonibacter mobilis]|nr:hypothetical protein [Tritonibacter mobilis]
MSWAAAGAFGGGVLSAIGGRQARKQQEKMFWVNRWDNLPEATIH